MADLSLDILNNVSLDTLKSDPKLFDAALAFAKKEFNSENILFFYDKSETKVLYEKYISTNAPLQVNLPGPLADPMHALAAASDWTNPAWTGHLKAARFNLVRMWRGDCKQRFLKTPEFRSTPTGQKAAAAASAANVSSAAAKAVSAGLATQKAASSAVAAQKASPAGQKQEKPEAPAPVARKADPKKAAKRLGITDPASLALLTKAVDLSFKKDRNGALKALTELAKKEELKLKADIILKQLEEAGF
jgi:hypothetical protein